MVGKFLLFQVICCSLASGGRLELTTIDVSGVNDESVIKLLNELDHHRHKVEIIHRKGHDDIQIYSQSSADQEEVSNLFREILNITEQGFSITQLPDIKVKDTYRRNKRDIQQFDVNAYNSFNSIADYLWELSVLHPALIRLKQLGKTYENRPVLLVILGEECNKPKPKIYVDGGQHAREWISPATILYLIQQYIEAVKNSAEHSFRDLLQRYELHMVPMMNPDGYVWTYIDGGYRFWRKNRKPTSDPECLGVDLNRNWNFHWSDRGGSTYECSTVYKGESALSEEETSAVANYIMNQTAWHSFFSLHSYGQMVLFPYSHTSVPSPDFDKHLYAGRQFAEGVKEVNNRSYVTGAVGIILYEAAGSSESWAYGAAGFPYAYSIELPDQQQFVLPEESIAPIAKEVLQGFIRYLSYLESTEPGLYDDVLLHHNDTGSSCEMTTAKERKNPTNYTTDTLLFTASSTAIRPINKLPAPASSSALRSYPVISMLSLLPFTCLL